MGNFRDVRFEESIVGQLENMGRSRANPNNWKDNMFKLTAKSEEGKTPTLYQVTHTSAAHTLSAITLDGTTYTLDTAIVVTDTAAIEAALYTIIQNHTPEVVNPILAATHDGTDLNVYYGATNVLTSLTINAGAVTPTVKATIYAETSFSFVVTKSQAGYLIGATALTAGATEATTTTAVLAALTTESVTNYGVVTVDIVGGNDQTVTVYVEGKDTPFLIDGLSPTYLQVTQNFK